MVKKVLVLNTSYKIPGGEDTNIVEEINYLSKLYEIEYLEFKNSDKLNVYDIVGFFLLTNFRSNRLLKNKIQSFQPDLIYVHNTWFKANLGIFKIFDNLQVPIVLKIHNFRYYCTQYFSSKKHLDNYSRCPMCNYSKSFLGFNKYFQESLLKSLFSIIYGKKFIRILQKSNLKILNLTKFSSIYLQRVGVSKEKIINYPNPIKSNSDNTYNPHSDYLVYAGRVTEDKGVSELIRAFFNSELSDLKLKIVGDGQDLNKLKNKFSKPNIEFCGNLSNQDTIDLISHSRGVVTATRMYEGQPRLLCEASINGVPSLYPDFGGMGEFFPKNYKFIFEQFNYDDLSEKLKLFNDNLFLEQLSIEVRTFLEKELNNEKQKKVFESFF